MRLLSALLLALALLAVSGQVALADCGRTIISDALDDGVVEAHYSQGCYALALGEVQGDTAEYSNVLAVIRQAKARDALSGQSGNSTTTTSPSSQTTTSGGGVVSGGGTGPPAATGAGSSTSRAPPSASTGVSPPPDPS